MEHSLQTFRPTDEYIKDMYFLLGQFSDLNKTQIIIKCVHYMACKLRVDNTKQLKLFKDEKESSK